MRWENWLEVLRLCSQMFRFSKSRHRLFILSKGKVKKHRTDLWDVFLGSGGRLWKGKVLAPFSSMVIHGLLVTCFRSLVFVFQLFEMVLCVWFWKYFEKEAIIVATFVMILVWTYTKVYCLLKNVSMFESLFWENVLKLCCEVFLKIGRMFASFDQVTKSCLPYLLKDLSYVFNPFNSVASPLYLVDNLVLGC